METGGKGEQASAERTPVADRGHRASAVCSHQRTWPGTGGPVSPRAACLTQRHSGGEETEVYLSLNMLDSSFGVCLSYLPLELWSLLNHLNLIEILC